MLFITFIFILHQLCALCTVAFGQSNDTQLLCVPFGTCEPCPESALNEPFCQPFGNRRLMHCVPASSSPTRGFSRGRGTPRERRPQRPGNERTGTLWPYAEEDDSPRAGEIPAWVSCGRIVEKERGDYYEFIACNFAIALLAVVAVFVRSKRLQALQTRNLAARIGLVRGVPGGWAST